MQPESSHTSPDPPIPQSSPTLPAYRHHTQPTPTIEPSNPLNATGLRQRRGVSPGHDSEIGSASASGSGSGTTRDPDVIRIQIQTPLSESSGARKEVTIERSLSVRELKDGLASGRWNRGESEGVRWVRDGMRLVWRGRIVKDEEVLGDVVKDVQGADTVHVFHLVARRLGLAPSRAPSYLNAAPATSAPQGPAAQATTPLIQTSIPAQPQSQSPTSQDRHPLSRNTTALSDTIHYLLFMARHHLCILLGAQPLAWDDTVPRPVIPQVVAREAVMSVVRAYASQREQREEGWEEWEAAFDDAQDLESESTSESERSAAEREIKSLWSSAVGKNWTDGEDGEIVTIELDETPYQLHLPPLSLLTPSQLNHLRFYLRITSLVPLLVPILEESRLSRPPSIHTPTSLTQPSPALIAALNQIANLPAGRQLAGGGGRVLFRLRIPIPIIPLPLVQHMVFSAMKVSVMLFMLTNGMNWYDFNFLFLAFAAMFWWFGDAYSEMRRMMPRNNQRQGNGNANQAGPVPAQGQAEAQGRAQGQNQGQGQGQGQAGATGVNNVGNGFRGQTQAQGIQSLATSIPLVHLATDSDQLGHPTVFSSPSAVHNSPRPSSRVPSRWYTQLLLPVALWFITLIPEWESMRARAIRRRERAMRVVVGELTTREKDRLAAAATEQASAEEGSGDQTAVGDGQSGPSASGADADVADPAPVYPTGLNTVAKRYYERVMTRGEGIDWEEEREAQRALGVGDEEPEGDGMRMRML